MADLGLIGRFGQSVSFDQTAKTVTINLNDLSNINLSGVNYGLDSSAMTSSNKDQYASKILWALILLNQVNQNQDNNDDTVKLYVTNQGKRSVNRNSVPQFGYQLVITAYKNDTLGVSLDPDSL